MAGIIKSFQAQKIKQRGDHSAQEKEIREQNAQLAEIVTRQ